MKNHEIVGNLQWCPVNWCMSSIFFKYHLFADVYPFADTMQSVPSVHYEKMRGTRCFYASVFGLSHPIPTPLSHTSSLCSPLFEVAQECSSNSWPQENKMSLESALCQIG